MYNIDICKLHIQYLSDIFQKEFLSCRYDNILSVCNTGLFQWGVVDEKMPLRFYIHQKACHIKANHTDAPYILGDHLRKFISIFLPLEKFGFKQDHNIKCIFKDYGNEFRLSLAESSTSKHRFKQDCFQLSFVDRNVNYNSIIIEDFCGKCNFQSIAKLMKDIDRTILATIKLKEDAKLKAQKAIKLAQLNQNTAVLRIEELIKKLELPLYIKSSQDMLILTDKDGNKIASEHHFNRNYVHPGKIIFYVKKYERTLNSQDTKEVRPAIECIC